MNTITLIIIMFALIFVVTFVGTLIFISKNSEQNFIKKCNMITKGMSINDVISIMGNNYTRSENENESILEWRKTKNGIMINQGKIKGRQTLLGAKAKVSGNTVVESGHTISFKVTFVNNLVTNFTTTTNDN